MTSCVFRRILNKVTATTLSIFVPQVAETLEKCDEAGVVSFVEMVFLLSRNNPTLNSVLSRLLYQACSLTNSEALRSALVSASKAKFETSPAFVSFLFRDLLVSALDLPVNFETESLAEAWCQFILAFPEGECSHTELALIGEIVGKLKLLTPESSKVKFFILNVLERSARFFEKVIELYPAHQNQKKLQNICLEDSPPNERTIYVSHLDCEATEGEFMQLLTLFGEVLKVRLCGNPSQSTRYSFVEYLDRKSAKNFLQMEGRRFQRYNLHCSRSRNVIHDSDTTDAVCYGGQVLKACTFGLDAEAKWNDNPLNSTSSKDVRSSSVSKRFFETESLLALGDRELLNHLNHISNDPEPTLLSLIRIGLTKPNRVAEILALWCFSGNLLTAWVSCAFLRVQSEPHNPQLLMKLGTLLIQNKTISKI